MTQLRTAPPETTSADRRIRPVVGWAIVGAAVTTLAFYGWIRWFTSGDATSIGTGPDPVPAHVRVTIIVFQVFSSACAIGAITYVVRGVRRARGMTFDAMLWLGWALAWWHDPIINWLHPVIWYNASAVNLGSWTEQLPGWYSPGAATMPEPLLVIGTVYLWMGLSCAVFADQVMTAARRRRPHWGAVRIFLAGWAAIAAGELIMEIIAVRLEITAYPASIPWLTLWAGTTHQLPLYGCFFWSLTLTIPGALRHFRSVDGRSAVERGADRVTSRRRTLVSTLAVIGFVNVTAVGYDVLMVGASVHAGEVDEYPSYFRTSQCGPGTDVPCPGPGVPIVPRD